MEEKRSIYIQSFENLSQSSRQRNIDYLDDEILMQAFLPFGESTFTRSKTENPKNLHA